MNYLKVEVKGKGGHLFQNNFLSPMGTSMKLFLVWLFVILGTSLNIQITSET